MFPNYTEREFKFLDDLWNKDTQTWDDFRHDANGWKFSKDRWVVDPHTMPRNTVQVEVDPLNKVDPWKVFENIEWVTLSPASDAKKYNHFQHRALTREERKAVPSPDKCWILRQPYAGLRPNSSPFETEMIIPAGASVEYILECISKMTVVSGRFAIADHVYFEGLDERDGIWYVLTGS